MAKKDIVVIGASAGGMEALQKLVAGLPADLPAAVFVVWHLAPGVKSLLPEVLNRAGPFGAANPEPVIALPAHQLVYADEVGQAHLRLRFKSGDGAIVNGIAFRSIGQKLGNALLANRGQQLHVAGALSLDRYQGAERVQLRVIDVALPDQGPQTIR